MNPIQLFDPASSTYTYVLFDADSREALIIDPVDAQLQRDLALLREYGLRLVLAVETHAHADHVTSAGLLVEHTGARTAAPEACGIRTAALQLHDGTELSFGRERLRALHTPGHTAGSMSYFWESGGHRHVFTGDTLLINGCGRTDFQSGSAEALYRSLTEVLFSLPDDTVVWPGHDYHGRQQSTIGAEKRSNARIAGKSREEFLALMAGLNLPRPQRIAEAVPANLRSGLRHDAEEAELFGARAAQGYAGDVSPRQAWRWMEEGSALMVDVRTDAEREWVGFVPGALGIAWKQWPGMAPNADFDRLLLAAATPGKKIVMLCRSGVRSVAAARRATELGLEAYNVLEGFEGDPDDQAQRGHRSGWRYHGLPWRQG
ncbi:MAG: MBL fold metallo-hydrolase [Curvibacter sp.]|jgi:sulfur dioxygenase|nr:MBL fold metallo-hydrolase [Curvibacter sp.]